MLLCLVKIVFAFGPGRLAIGLAGCLALVQGGVVLLVCGQDREGPLRAEGKLLSGHGQQGQDGVPGAADESFAGQRGAAADYRVRPPPESER